MKFTLNEAFKFGWPGLDGYAYNSKDDFLRASAALFIVTGRHGKVKNSESDRVYFVIEGNGQFFIENKTINVKDNDVIIISKNTIYDYEGKMKLFLVHTPAYDEKNETDYEKMQTK